MAENFSDKISDNKKAQETQLLQIQSFGMEVMAGFIVGFDNDPEDIFERQIEFIRRILIGSETLGANQTKRREFSQVEKAPLTR